jgi:hypothetical protein
VVEEPFLSKLLQHLRKVPPVFFVAEYGGRCARRLRCQKVCLEFPGGVTALAWGALSLALAPHVQGLVRPAARWHHGIARYEHDKRRAVPSVPLES